MGAISGLNSEHLCVYVDVPNKLPNLVIVSAFFFLGWCWKIFSVHSFSFAFNQMNTKDRSPPTLCNYNEE